MTDTERQTTFPERALRRALRAYIAHHSSSAELTRAAVTRAAGNAWGFWQSLKFMLGPTVPVPQMNVVGSARLELLWAMPAVKLQADIYDDQSVVYRRVQPLGGYSYNCTFADFVRLLRTFVPEPVTEATAASTEDGIEWGTV